MRALHEIGADEAALQEFLLNQDGEIPNGPEGDALEAYMANLADERDEKLRRICGLIRNLEADASSCEAQATVIEKEAQFVKAAGKAAENAAHRLKARVKRYFEEHGIQKLELSALFKPRIQANSQAPLLVPVAWEKDPASAPESFHKKTIELDRAGVGLVIKLGSMNGHDRLCPKCGGFADVVDREAVIDDVKTEIPTAVCMECKWEGKPDETARFGPKGTHLRLR
jgi:hypothetical protein